MNSDQIIIITNSDAYIAINASYQIIKTFPFQDLAVTKRPWQLVLEWMEQNNFYVPEDNWKTFGFLRNRVTKTQPRKGHYKCLSCSTYMDYKPRCDKCERD